MFGGVLLHQSGELRGTGLINGDVFVGGSPSEARFQPGNSPGTLTIDGGYVQEEGGLLELEIAGIDPGEFDVVDASNGLVFNGGMILFQRTGGFPGHIGAQVDVFAGGPVTMGNVQIIDNTGLALEFDPNTGVVTLPEPGQAILSGVGMLGVVLLATRRDRSKRPRLG